MCCSAIRQASCSLAADERVPGAVLGLVHQRRGLLQGMSAQASLHLPTPAAVSAWLMHDPAQCIWQKLEDAQLSGIWLCRGGCALLTLACLQSYQVIQGIGFGGGSVFFNAGAALLLARQSRGRCRPSYQQVQSHAVLTTLPIQLVHCSCACCLKQASLGTQAAPAEDRGSAAQCARRRIACNHACHICSD